MKKINKMLSLVALATIFTFAGHAQTQFNVTGGGSYCEGGSGLEIGLDGSEDTKEYELYLDDSSTGITEPGDGNAITFGLQTSEGTYTVKLVDSGTFMDGTAEITIDPILTPSVSISASQSESICEGTEVTFTATPTNGGASPEYQWKLNGSNVGTDQTTYSNSSLTDGDNVSCVMTSSETCTSENPVTSNVITMVVTTNVTPSVSISASPSESICEGTEVTFTATPTNGGASPEYQWKLNGSNVGTDQTTYSNSSLTDGDNVSCVMTSSEACVTQSDATSNLITMAVSPTSVGGNVTGGGTIASGATSGELTLSGHVGAVQRWQYSIDGWGSENDIAHTGETYTSEALTQTTEFRAVVKSGACDEANSTATTVTVDEDAPTVTLTSVDGAFTTNSPFTVNFEFNENVVGFDDNDIEVHNGDVTDFGGAGDAYWAEITPTNPGTVAISVPEKVCTDIAGNDNEASDTLEVDYDITEEYELTEVTIQSDNMYSTSLAKEGNEITINFTSPRILDPDQLFVTIAGQTATVSISSPYNEGSATYEMTASESEGVIPFSIAHKDNHGNTGTTAISTTNASSVTFDRTPPNAPNFTGASTASPTQNRRPTWVWESTDAVDGSDNYRYKINDNNLSLGATETTETSYQPASDLSDGTHTLYVQERDDAGNWSPSGSLEIVVDNITETPTLIQPAQNTTSGVNLNIEFTLPEDAMSGTVKLIFVCTSNIIETVQDRVVVFNSNFEGAGTHSTTLNAEDLEDNANVENVYTEPSSGYPPKLFYGESYEVTIEYQDILGNPKASVTNTDFFYGNPTADIIEIDPNPRNTHVGIVDVGFSRKVKYATVTWDDFTLTRNGTNVTLTGLPDITYSEVDGETAQTFHLDLESLTADEGDYTLTLAASGSGIVDEQDNPLLDDASISWTCDITPPTVSLNANVSSPTNEESFTVTATISKPTDSFTQSIIEVSNASIISFTEENSTTYTFTVEASAEGLITIQVPEQSFMDMVGNENQTITKTSIIYDNTRPIPSITSSLESPTNETTIPITVDFGELVDGFDEDSVNIDGGSAPFSIESFSTTNNKVFTFNILATDPTNHTTATFVVEIPEAVCSDIASNTNELSDFTIDFDSTTPELNNVNIVSNHTNNKWVRVGKKVTLSFEAQKTIKDVVVTINEQNVTALFEGGVWTASYTFTDDDTDEGTVPFSIDFNDLAGNSGTQITHQNFGGNNVTFDKTKPVIANVSISTDNHSGIYAMPNDWANVSFTTDDGDAIISAKIRGITADVSGGATLTASRQMTGTDPEGFITFSITATDLAGNVSEPATATHDDTWVIFDKTPPEITSVTTEPGTYKVGDEISIIVHADDDIYTASSLEVNSQAIPSGNLVNNHNNSYTVIYAISENDPQHSGVVSLPVSIELSDMAGNTNPEETSANVTSESVTIDSQTPQIASITSNAEVVGNLIIGDAIEFTLTPENNEVDLNIFPEEYNNKPLEWEANTDGSIYTAVYQVEPDDTDNVTPLQLGEVTLVDAAGNISNPVLYNDIQKSIYGNKPTVSIIGSTSQCYSNNSSIPISFELTGYQPFALTYKVESNTYGPIDIPDINYSTTIDNLEVGEHTVSLNYLEDNPGNFNNIANQEATITIMPLPNIVFDVTSSPFNKDEQPVNLSLFVNPTGGTFSGTGVGTDGYFYPQLIDEEDYDEPIRITYTYTDTEGNGCTNTATYDVVVSDKGASMSVVNPAYCNYHEPFTVTGSNPIDAIGEFNVNSPTGWSAEGNILTITPGELDPGDYEITYSYQDEGVTYQASRNFTLDAASEEIDFGTLEPSYCKDSPAITLSAINANPAGGTHYYEGPAEGFTFIPGTSTATLVPSSIEAGQTYQITYHYVTAFGCSSDTINHSTQINPLPELDFTLQDNYNYDQEPILLSGNEPDGTFSGTGVSDNTLYPNLITPGPNHTSTGTPFTVLYSYTNPATQCSNSVSETSYVREANETIEGLNNEYCYSEDVMEISCTPEGFSDLEGTFVSNKGGITSTGFNQANYSIPDAGVGIDTVFFRYTIGDTEYEVFKRVLIDSIGPVSINGLEPNYCNNESQQIIVGDNGNHGQGIGNFSYTGTGDAFGNAGNLAYFSPIIETPGNYEITYTYQSSISSCQSEITMPVDINPIPEVHFNVSQACSDLTTDPVAFINNTISEDEVAEWLWNFNGEGESSDFEPSFLFQSSGDKLISLTATTTNGCSSQLDSTVLVGVIPKANFTWQNECLTQQETEFLATSEETNIANYKWVINDDLEFEGAELTSINYLFSEIGSQEVKLVLTSFDSCKDSITKQVFIHPLIQMSELPNNVYHEDFEAGYGNWIARSITDEGHFSWEHGTPEGSIINNAASGENSWFTNIDFSNQMIESSEVVSPCYDFSGLDKPMIKFNIWSSPDPGRDGAVMQYSLNQGATWHNLGDINTGVNWFNSSTIQSRPANQFIGWSNFQMDGWESARLSLDVIKNEPNVRFRIAYAADGNAINEFNGFAFDDVWIGDREQKVLLEYFTNTNIANSEASNQNIVDLENLNSSDIVPIHYHTSSPANDPVHDMFPTAMNAREVFYGVSNLPFALINGTNPLSFDNFSTNQNAIEVSSLKDSPFSIDLDAYYTDKIDIEVTLTSNEEINNNDILLQCALVQPTVNVTESASSGETIFYNVAREFLPNSGGTSLKSNWEPNENQSLTLSWDPQSEQILNKTEVVVFIQSINDKTIHQSESIGLWTLTSNPSNALAKEVLLYPNPASQHLVIESPKLIQTITIVDISGRVVWNGNFNKKAIVIPVAWLKNGIYLVSIECNNQKVTQKFIKQ
ncbi:MAG: Ig-like domain-containing protein [Bacteroidales bacterium]